MSDQGRNILILSAGAWVLTAYALWHTGYTAYSLWAFRQFQNVPQNFILRMILSRVSMILSVVAWWAVAAIAWAVRAEAHRRAPAAAPEAPPPEQAGDVWPPQPLSRP